MIIRPKNDHELCDALGLTVGQLRAVIGYIKTGEVEISETTNPCPACDGFGRWDDIPCGSCGGTGKRKLPS